MKSFFLIFISFLVLQYNFAQSKIEIWGTVGLKKSIIYPGTYENTNNTYKLSTNINPILGINAKKSINNKFGLFIGGSITYNNIILNINHKTEHSEDNFKNKLKLFSIKLPLGIYYHPNKKLSFELSVSPNYFNYTMIKSSMNISGDSIATSANFIAPFINKFTISSQIGITYYLSPKSALNLNWDIDWGKYPKMESLFQIEDLKTNQKKNYKFKAEPKIMTLGINYSYKLW